MSKYNENMNILKEFIPDVYNIIASDNPQLAVKVEKLENEDNYLLTTDKAKCYLHSLYNIDNEMEMMFKHIETEVESIVIFGVGNGYCLEYIKKRFTKIKKIIIIEPHLTLFKELLNNIYLKNIVSSFKEVSFIINKTKEQAAFMLGDILTNDLYKKYSFSYNITYRTIYDEYYEHINNYLSERINHKIVNIVTQEMFKYIWPINIIRNMKYNNELIDRLFGKFNDVPAILVSAGPSLNKNIHLLKEISNRAIVVAVGSAIKILNNAGITPDFYFAVDAAKEGVDIFDGIKTENTTLIYGDKLYYEILPNYQGKKLKMILDLDFLGKYIYDKANISYVESKSGFSIANIALGVLHQFGCKKIIFMGQDLCYSDNKEYAEGSWKEEDLNFENNNFIRKKDIYGNDVFTIAPYLGMKKIFENYIKNNPSMEFINATEGGLGIDGAKIKKFQTVLIEDLSQSYNISEIIDRFFRSYNGNDKKFINNSMVLMNEEIEKLLLIIEKGINEIPMKAANNSYIVIKEEISILLDKLELVQFYKDVVIMSLKSNFDSIDIKCNSNSDKDMLVKNILNKLIETREFLHLIEVLIKEYFGEKHLDIDF